MLKNKIVNSVSRLALVAAMAGTAIMPVASVSAAGGLLDNASSTATTQTSSSSSASQSASSDSSNASSQSSSDASNSSATSSSAASDASAASDTAASASEDSNSAASSAASDASAASAKVSSIPKTGMHNDAAKAGLAVGVTAVAAAAAFGVGYKKRHADDNNIR